MAKKTKTLLILGDEKDFDTYLKLINQKRFFYRSPIKVRHIDYSSLLKNKLPSISSNEIIIFPCFPFYYWDKYIEPKNIEHVSVGHGAGTFNYGLDIALMQKPTERIYFLEDDYDCYLTLSINLL